MSGFVGAVVALLIGFTAPLSVTIPRLYNRTFYHDALTTRQTGDEVSYCLVGYQKDGHYRVTAVVKPDQRTYRTTEWAPNAEGKMTLWLISGVEQTPCGVGTIMDLHTHPFGDNTPTPSPQDIATWKKDRNPLHGIIEQGLDGKVRISIWGPTGEQITDLRTP